MLDSERDSQLVALAIETDPVFGPLFHDLTNDPNLDNAWKDVDVPAFVQHMSAATEHMKAYVGYQQREERLWAIKIGTGKLSTELEDGLKRSVAAARDRFQKGFAELDASLKVVESSEFKSIANTHVAAMSKRCMFDMGNAFGRTASSYFHGLGFSSAQVGEFKRQFAPIGYDFIGTLGKGDMSNLRAYAAPGIEANVEIMNYTEKHGLDYIRGAGPPAWAVTAASILAYFGIAISAWVIVAIAAAILITLAALCAAYWNRLPAWARAGCVALASAGLIGFVF